MKVSNSERFRYLEHTADAKFQAFGKTLAEAFGNAALAMFNEIVNIDSVNARVSKEVSVSGVKNTTLLYDFLSELLYLLDTEGYLVCQITSLKIEHKEGLFVLSAVVGGDYSRSGYEVTGSIKSVTYSEMVIDESSDGNVMVQVVVDI